MLGNANRMTRTCAAGRIVHDRHISCGKKYERTPGLCAMQPTLRIMLVDDSESRSRELRLMLGDLGHDVVAEVRNPRELYAKVKTMAPDVIIIDTDSPSRDTLEHVALLSEQDPRPIVMFSADRDGDTIRAIV